LGQAHIRRERWQWLEIDHNPVKKKPTRGNTEAEKEKKDIASTALRRKGMVIHL
jgi:hypothetical protein